MMGNLNFNNLFIGLSLEQIIVLLVLVIISVLFGLMAGASIFYPLGYRRCRKDGKGGDESAAQSTQDALVAAVLAQQADVPDTFDEDDSFEYTSDDLFNFVDEDEEASAVQDAATPTETDQAATAQDAAATAETAPIVDEVPVVPALMDVAPGSGEQIKVVGEPLRDEAFVQMEERSKQMAPLVSRTVLLNYCERMVPLANALPIRVTEQDKDHPYDRLSVNDYTFAVLFEYNKVLRLVLRLHANTIGALRQSAGDAVAQEESFGADWYSWVVTDIEHCEKVVAKVLDMSYKYVAHTCYKRGKDGGFMPKAESYEDAVTEAADAYRPAEDARYAALAEQMNAKYQLYYFGKKEAEEFARTIAGELPVTVEDTGSITVFKAGSYLFAAVYESYGVVKLLFRADKEYVDVLRSEHPYVGCSEVPKSEYRQWYYAILDKSFDNAQCTEVIKTAYQHVLAQNNG